MSLPFTGETMVCTICGEVQKSDPTVDSKWWMLTNSLVRWYYCPKHDIKTITEHFIRLLYELG